MNGFLLNNSSDDDIYNFSLSDDENLHEETISIDPVVICHGPVLRKRKHNEAIMKIVIITIELQIVVINLMDSFLNV